MFHYYLDRGLSAVEFLAQQFKDRQWYLPNLICDEVLNKIKEHVTDIIFYEINSDFGWSAKIGEGNPKIFYVIDYFGKEFRVGVSSPPNTIIIKDSVWFPYPFSKLEGNTVWFNSLRKIFRGAKGASLVSPYRLPPLNEVPNVYYHPSLTMKEVDIRFRNFYKCIDIFNKYIIDDFLPDFPTVIPLRFKDRDKVLENAGLTGKLPGMWANKYGLSNPLYEDLVLIPIDSRFNEESLIELSRRLEWTLALSEREK